MIDISVIFSSYGARANDLNRALDALRAQSLPKSQWEILLAGGSDSDRSPGATDISWQSNARNVSSVAEAIGAAVGGVLIFDADDNILDADYLRKVLDISRAWPRIGAWDSGRTELQVEGNLPERLQAASSVLGGRAAECPLWSNVLNCCLDLLAWRAGFCVRADVAAQYLHLSRLQAVGDHRGGVTFGTGDYHEFGYVVSTMGLGMGLFPELKQVRLIPKEYASVSSLMRQRERQVFARHLLDEKWQVPKRSDPRSALSLLIGLQEVLKSRGIRRRLALAELVATLKARRALRAGKS